MGIEDRLREDLRRTARTATGADVLPRGPVAEDPAPHRPPETRRRRSGRDRGALAASVVTLLWLVIAFTGARDQHLANPTVLSVGARPSQHCGVLTLRSRCFGVSHYPSAARLRPEQW